MTQTPFDRDARVESFRDALAEAETVMSRFIHPKPDSDHDHPWSVLLRVRAVLAAPTQDTPRAGTGEVEALRALRNLLDRYHVMGCGDGPEALEADRVLHTHVLAAPSDQPPAGSAASGDGLRDYLVRQWGWSKETFGPHLRTKGVIQHITKELREIEANPHDLSEWVDVIILAMDGFWRHGGKPEDLLPAMQAKQDKNFARSWPDWRTMGEDQAIEHDRSGDETSPADRPDREAARKNFLDAYDTATRTSEPFDWMLAAQLGKQYDNAILALKPAPATGEAVEALNEIAKLSPEPDDKAWRDEWNDPASYRFFDIIGDVRETSVDTSNHGDIESYGFEMGQHAAAVIARKALAALAAIQPATPATGVAEAVAALNNAFGKLRDLADDIGYKRHAFSVMAATARAVAEEIRTTRTALATLAGTAAGATPSTSADFDWQIVSDAVTDAISNGEGHLSEGYLKLAFDRHGLVVIDAPSAPPPPADTHEGA